MTKALFKKQMAEVFSWFYFDRKSGKRRGKSGIIGYAVLYLFLFVMLGYIFWSMAEMLCAPLVSAGFGWLYMALMSLVGVAFGVFGSVFNTYSSLYTAKDNDLLLSMPIPPSRILLIRLTGVYAMGLMYELIVMIPAVAVYLLRTEFRPAACVFNLLLPFILSVFVLTLSCILGFAVALVGSRLKNKNIITVVLSLAFLAVYFYVYSQAYSLLESILADPASLGDKIRSGLYPFYLLGLASEGHILSMLIFTGIVALLFGAVYGILSRSFLKLATRHAGGKRTRYREKPIRAGGVSSALFKKELRRFLGSPTYMLNCGLGIVLMPIAAVALFVKGGAVSEMLNGVFGGASGFVPLIGAAAVCMMSTMNDLTAPSVSLEGKNIWLVQSLPVTAAQVLSAKLKLHLCLTVPPALLLTAAVLWTVRPAWYWYLSFPLAVLGFIVFMGLSGLWLNLRLPNLDWTNEIVPVKQGMSVGLCLFGGWVVVLVLSGLYLVAALWISPELYLALVTLLLFALSGVLFRWVKTKGAAIFERL